MPRTKGWSCCARQIGSAAARSSALKLTEQGVPVEQLVALQQAGRSPHQPFGHPALQSRRDHRQRRGLELGGGLCELVEESYLLPAQAVAAAQRPAEPAAVLAPCG